MLMEINKPTPLSRLVSLIVFVGIVPALCFYIGVEYLLTTQMVEAADVDIVPIQYVIPDDCLE